MEHRHWNMMKGWSDLPWNEPNTWHPPIYLNIQRDYVMVKICIGGKDQFQPVKMPSWIGTMKYLCINTVGQDIHLKPVISPKLFGVTPKRLAVRQLKALAQRGFTLLVITIHQEMYEDFSSKMWPIHHMDNQANDFSPIGLKLRFTTTNLIIDHHQHLQPLPSMQSLAVYKN